jgi:hypothetical protein
MGLLVQNTYIPTKNTSSSNIALHLQTYLNCKSHHLHFWLANQYYTLKWPLCFILWTISARVKERLSALSPLATVGDGGKH